MHHPTDPTDPTISKEFTGAPVAAGEGEGTPPCTALGGAVHGTPSFTKTDAQRAFLGKTVSTSYSTGPYRVTKVEGPCKCVEYIASLDGDKTPSEWHVHLTGRKDGDRSDSYLNGFRLDGTSVWNDDTITVEGGTPSGSLTSHDLADYKTPAIAGQLPVNTFCRLAKQKGLFRIGEICSDAVTFLGPRGVMYVNSPDTEVFICESNVPVEGKLITDWTEEDWNNFNAEREVKKHKVSVRVGDKSYPARISEALNAMPDWRDTPEYERLGASAARDRKFQQPVLGKLVMGGSRAWPVQMFEIEDGRHRFWQAEENGLDSIEGKLTEMPVAELMLRSLLERRHLEKGARAYLAWPVIQPFVAANKEASKERHIANLKKAAAAKKKKGEANCNPADGISVESSLAEICESSLPEAESKKFKELAESYGIGHTLLDQARRVHEIFARRKDLKLENEPLILAGELGLGACIAGVAGKEATEGKERKDTPPADLLRRSFRDLRIRFAPDRWNAVPDTDRHAVAGELVETVLDLPEDVRARLKTALA